MDSGQIFVLGIIALSMLGGTLSVWIKARHGYPIEHSRRSRRRWRSNGVMGWMSAAQPDETGADRKIELLSSENERLTGQIGRLEERLRVLERIATDPAERTAREIDALRGETN